MKKFLVLGGYEPYIIEAEEWEEALWKALSILGDSLASITIIPAKEGEG